MKKANNTCILDASAVLAWMNQEPGHEEVEKNLPGSFISAVSFSEVLLSLVQLGVPLEEVQTVLQGLFQVIEFSEGHVWTAMELGSATSMKGFSLGDRASLALGRHLRLPVLTANQDRKDLDCGVEITVIR